MAAAWLLTSRVALDNCDSVLRFSVIRQEDLDCAFLEDGGSSNEEGRRAALEGVLQGLAALEVDGWDMVAAVGIHSALRYSTLRR